MALKEKTIQLKNGASVHYWEDGPQKAAPVLLLHGSVGDAAFHWAKLIPELSHSYHLYAPDLPGFGASDVLPEMSYPALLAWLDEIFAVLEIRHAVIIGNSFGGLLARLYAAVHPQQVPALILINGGVLPSQSSGFISFIANLPLVGDLLFNSMSKQGVGSRKALDWLLADGDKLTDEMVVAAAESASGLAMVMRMQLLDNLPEERVPMLPTMLLWGVGDELAPLKAGKAIQRAIPSAELREIEGTKHTPHIEEPEVVGFQIQSFVENLGRSQKPSRPGAGPLPMR